MTQAVPALVIAADGITGTASEAEAVRGADLVLSVSSAKAAVDAFQAGLARNPATPASPTSES